MKHLILIGLLVLTVACNEIQLTGTSGSGTTSTPIVSNNPVTTTQEPLTALQIIEAMNPVSYWATPGVLGFNQDLIGQNNELNQLVTDSSSLDNPQFSVYMRFTPPGAGVHSPSYQRLFEKGGYKANNGGLSAEYNSLGNIQCLLWNDTSDVISQIVYPITSLSAGQNNIVCTYDGSTHAMYINGTLIGTNASAYYQSSSVLAIGRASQVDDYYFQGTIGDTVIWDRALTQAEVTNLQTLP